MFTVAKLIARVLEHISDEDVLADVRLKVGELTSRFPLYPWKR
jgi:glycine/serine hydroxymethyltransferase